MKPSIVDFDSDVQSVMAGSPLSLSWDVRRARNLELRNLPPEIEGDCALLGDLADDRSCTLITDQPGNYTIRLIATGWFRSDERTIQIAVDPDPGHPPEVVTFTLEPSEVTSGDPVTITWNVENAERVVITFPNGVEREVPGSGAMEDVPTQTGSYTLRAHNPGGDTDPLLLGISVAQPTPEPTVPPSPVTTEATAPPGEPSPTPAPAPPTLAIEPHMNATLPEGVCLKLAWDIQNAATTQLDGDPIPASGDRVVCPVASTTYTWQVTGHDGMDYSQARQVIVEPFLVDENVTIDDFAGTWITTDDETLGITRMVIAKTPQNELQVTTFMRFLPLDQLVLLGYGIELDQLTVPFEPHKPRIVYEDPHLRVTLGKKNDLLLARVYYFEHEFAKEYELQRQLVIQPVPITPQVQFIPPDKFWEQPLFNLP
jgi:hypothetical protein